MHHTIHLIKYLDNSVIYICTIDRIGKLMYYVLMFTNIQLQPIVFTSKDSATGQFLVNDADLGETYIEALEARLKREALRIAFHNVLAVLRTATQAVAGIRLEYRRTIPE